MSIPNCNLMSRLELPILFYVLCLIMNVSERVSQPEFHLALGLCRPAGGASLVHPTFNNVLVSLAVFGISNVVVVVTWALFFLGPMQGLSQLTI